jgi:hypothetical protein
LFFGLSPGSLSTVQDTVQCCPVLCCPVLCPRIKETKGRTPVNVGNRPHRDNGEGEVAPLPYPLACANLVVSKIKQFGRGGCDESQEVVIANDWLDVGITVSGRMWHTPTYAHPCPADSDAHPNSCIHVKRARLLAHRGLANQDP